MIDTAGALVRNGRKRSVSFALVSLAVLAAAWLVGLVAFVRHIPSEVGDTDTLTDAIVVLTGGSQRLDTGFRLLADNKASRVFVSGVFRGVDTDQLLKAMPDASSELACCIETGHGAANTAGNAAETAAWMRRHGYSTLRLVTGSYHMPRSLLEFRFVLPEAKVIPHPVFPEAVKLDQWWQSPGTAGLVISEYNKYLLAWVRHMFADSAQSS